MEFTINSRKLKRKVTFFTDNETSFVFVNLNNKSGSLGNQIFRSGSLAGNAISFESDDIEAFKKLCLSWFKQHIAYNY